MTIEDLRELAEKEQTRQAQFEHRILYCSSAGCVSSGCDAIKAEMKKAIDELGLSKKCELIGTGCLGLCGEGPLVYVHSDPTLYQHVDVKAARRIVEEHIGQGKKVHKKSIFNGEKTNYWKKNRKKHVLEQKNGQKGQAFVLTAN